MSHVPSIRMIREAIDAQARLTAVDEVGLEALRGDVERMVHGIRRAIDRAREFASRGLVSEAASVIEDFPDLTRQAQELADFPRASAAMARFWSTVVDVGADPIALPTADDVDQLASFVDQATRLRPLLDALRVAALRHEPVGNRLAILRKLREADGRNRLWLDQIDALEREWVKRIAEMRTDASASRAELEEAFTALATRQWVAPVPRGLKDEIYHRLKPLRAEEAGDRYAELAAQIHDASALMDRDALERLEAAWAAVFHETGRMPSEDLQAVVAPGFAWLGTAAEEDRRQSEFDGMVERLERALDGRQPVAEVERLLAALRDSGRSAPEGVVARAHAWIDAERDRARRRHRVILVASLAAAAAVLAAGWMAVAVYSRTVARDSAYAVLLKAVEAGDAPVARDLAAEVRANPELASAEMSALLARTDELGRNWDVERTQLAAELDALERELARAATRKRLAEIATAITAATPRARLEAESQRIALIERLHAERLVERDGVDTRTTDAALSAVDNMLADWPLPDRWKPAELLDLGRWSAYATALERAKGAIERTLLDIAGADVQESRLRLRMEGVGNRLKEAQSRREELATALAALDDRKIGASVSVESDLIERLDAVLAERGGTLQRMGLLGGFEASQRSGPAWRSVQAWRDEVHPRIEFALKDPGDTTAAAAALAALQDFLARHPDSPYRQSADNLIRRVDPASAVPLWTAERVHGALVDHFYADIEEVPLRGTDAFFYRRLAPDARNPMQRAIENLDDLRTQPRELNSMLLRPGEQIAGTTRPCAVSVLWVAIEREAAAADHLSVQGVLLGLLERLRTGTDGDPLLRARALRDAAVVLKQSGHAPAEALQPLDAWFAQCSTQWADALTVDWAKAAYEVPGNIRALRRDAESLIRAFPALPAIADAAREERERMRSEIRPLAPIGVLLPAASGVTVRRLGEDRPDGSVVVVVREGPRWRFVEASLVGGGIALPIAGLPDGPVLVFRRVGR